MLQLEMTLLSLPVTTAAAPNQMFPPLVVVAIVDEPKIEALVIVLVVASVWKRIVLVPEVAETVVLAMVSALPPVFRPSIVTLSAPLRSISGRLPLQSHR